VSGAEPFPIIAAIAVGQGQFPSGYGRGQRDVRVVRTFRFASKSFFVYQPARDLRGCLVQASFVCAGFFANTNKGPHPSKRSLSGAPFGFSACRGVGRITRGQQPISQPILAGPRNGCLRYGDCSPATRLPHPVALKASWLRRHGVIWNTTPQPYDPHPMPPPVVAP
jgi:hypothetical protein